MAEPVTYAGYLQGANVWVSVSAFVLGASMLVFIANLVWSLVFAREPAGSNPWGSKSIEWQLPTPVPLHDFEQQLRLTGEMAVNRAGGNPAQLCDRRHRSAGKAVLGEELCRRVQDALARRLDGDRFAPQPLTRRDEL